MSIELNELNMCYVSNDNGNEEIEGGAILECSRSWSVDQLSEWLPDYDFDAIETVKQWLANDPCISEGLYLKVWSD